MKLIGPVSRRAWNTHNSHLHGVDLGVRHGLESRTASRESKFGNLASAKLCIMISRILYLKISITLKSCLESYQRFGISYAAFSWWTPRSRQGNSLPHVTKEEEAIKARVIYDSAFHPDTSAKINVFGRMSSRVPQLWDISCWCFTDILHVSRCSHVSLHYYPCIILLHTDYVPLIEVFILN